MGGYLKFCGKWNAFILHKQNLIINRCPNLLPCYMGYAPNHGAKKEGNVIESLFNLLMYYCNISIDNSVIVYGFHLLKQNI